ncbi:acetolactate synthase large subunit [Elioraea rosea]|uniref:acetolactate synthase large subunit n=1 Tax=Elioraea rosea TaxID=2492390 RepID=UPI001183D5DA|nr:acetolactate synthase large subunit [Elioraea rosea]
MNGAESLVHTLLASGVDTCFANPGTSEMHFVAALDRVPGMRCVLGLFEGVVTGAADGYARMAEKPAATLLHCGPGLANALSNIHNARRARSPMVNIVGDHATYHRPWDAPLTSDVEGVARPFSDWLRTGLSARNIAADGAAAVQAARSAPGQIATLILPANTAWEEADDPVAPLPVAAPTAASPQQVETAARLLQRNGSKVVLLLAGAALREEGQRAAWRIASATGAKVMAQMSNARIERGQGRYPIERVPYPVDTALAALAPYATCILVGAKHPVAFFAYPGKPGSLLPEGCEVHVLARPDQDVAAAIEDLADQVAAGTAAPMPNDGPRPTAPGGPITSEGIARTVAALMPENAIIVDEGVTTGRGFFPETHNAPKHDWLQLTGGSIGEGLPLALGASIACPERKVIGLQADGSAMYTLQALWTMAREGCDATIIVFSNRKYAILRQELMNVGANPGRTALDMLDLGNPDLDWVKLAGGMGVEGAVAGDLDRLADLMRQAMARRGPFLIELLVP